MPVEYLSGAGAGGEAALRRRYRRAAAAGFAALAAFGAVRIAVFLPSDRALREAAATAAALAVFLAVSGFASRKIALHRPTRSGAETPAGRLGPAVPITLFRLGLVSLLAGGTAALLPFPEEPNGGDWLPFLLYAPAVLADALDGAVARRAGFATRFGALLDRETDAAGLAAGSLLAAASSGALPRWYLAAGFARYLAGAALAAESRLGRRRRPLDASPFRRRLAGFQMALVAASLAPAASPRWFGPAALALGLPFLAGFARDYLVMSGRLDPEGRPWRAAARALARARRPLSAVAAVSAAGCGALWISGVPELGPPAAAAGLFAALTATGSSPPRDTGKPPAEGK